MGTAPAVSSRWRQSIALFSIVLASRLVVLPDGPWEQDEVLFAAGVVDFDVANHRPHPPGFPLWVAIGRVFQLFFSDALLSLQVASSVASAWIVVLLASLLRLLTTPRNAVLAALAYACLPLTWLHAHRGFSTTPALALTITAVWLWTHGQKKPGGQWLAWILLAAATGVRPQLILLYGAVAAFGLVQSGSSGRWRVGVVVYTSSVVLCYAPVLFDGEGPLALLSAARHHVVRHQLALDEASWFTTWGVVRALGGSVPAIALLSGVGLGLVLPFVTATARPLRPHAAWLGLWFVVGSVSVLALHHPGFPRYSLTIVLIAWPALVMAPRSMPPPWPSLVWTFAIIAGLAGSWRPLADMHRQRLPVVEALTSIDIDHTRAIVSDASTRPFVRWHLDQLGIRYEHKPGEGVFVLDGRRDGETVAVLGPAARLEPGLTSLERRFDGFPISLQRYGQQRLDRTFLATDPVWVSRFGHAVEIDDRGEPFAWLSERAELSFAVTPHRPSSLVLVLMNPTRHGRQRMHATIGRKRIVELELDAGITEITVPTQPCPSTKPTCTVRLELPDALAISEPSRPLSVQLLGAWLESPHHHPIARAWSPGLPVSMATSRIRVEGAYGPEAFGTTPDWGAWLSAHATIDQPFANGDLVLDVARPAHLTGDVVFESEAGTVRVQVGTRRMSVRVPIGATAGPVTVTSPAFRPAERSLSNDERELGLILFGGRFEPRTRP